MYPLIIAKLFNEAWLIEPSAHRAMQEALHLALLGGPAHEAVVLRAEQASEKEPPLASLAASMGATRSARNRYLMTYGNTGVISMYGIMGKHLSAMESMCGGCSMDTVAQAMDIVAHDPDIKKVVLDVSSPGGQTIGTEELARQFADLADVHGKKTYAVTENQMGSAAYWVGSQARNGLYATPSSLVGSIGTYMAFTDNSEEMAKLGRKTEVIKSQGSDFKAMGLPGTTLTEDQRAFLQSHADGVNARFKSAVLKSRDGKIDEANMRGQFFRGHEARSKGYIDSNITSVTSFLRKIG